MSMLNKSGDVFTLLGIQEEIEENRHQQNENGYEEIISQIRKKGGIIPHHSPNDYCSTIENEQNR
mgnify:CR=1 FL=1